MKYEVGKTVIINGNECTVMWTKSVRSLNRETTAWENYKESDYVIGYRTNDELSCEFKNTNEMVISREEFWG